MSDIREIERASIREFVQQAANDGFLTGRVLDYAAGQSPYRQIVEGCGAEHVPFDPDYADIADNWREKVPFHSVLCTQAVQYLPEPEQVFRDWERALYGERNLVMTGPTNWPIVEQTDLWRFTPNGIATLLKAANFEIVRLEERGRFDYGGDSRWILGWGVVARAV
jgi:hypothetical protein